MRSLTLGALAAGGAALLLSLTSASAAGSGADDDAVAAAIDAVVDLLAAAGFVSDGAVDDDDPDVFDVVPDDAADAAGSDYSCTADIATLLDDDGSLVGETARAHSESYSFAAEPAETAPANADNVTAVALAVDDGGRDALAAIVAGFGSDELEECLESSFEQVLGAGADAGAVTVRADDDLGIGDQSSSFTIANHSVEYRFDSTLLFTRVGDRVGMVVFFRSGGPDSGFDPLTALAAMAEELGR
jgi:hypothetical protein